MKLHIANTPADQSIHTQSLRCQVPASCSLRTASILVLLSPL
ncbi:MAG: hypothetical protein ACLQMO_03785 [Acidobacteriaceae bacterium]